MDFRDMVESTLDGQALYESWRREFESEFYRPMVVMTMAMRWRSLPQNVKDELETIDPDMVNRIRQEVDDGPVAL